MEDRQVTVELAVLMSLWTHHPQVGQAVQDAVKSSVESMTGLTVAAVNRRGRITRKRSSRPADLSGRS